MLLDYGPTNGIFLDLGIAYPRVNAALLMNLFYRKGYDIVYLAGRPANLKVNGMSMRDATFAAVDAVQSGSLCVVEFSVSGTSAPDGSSTRIRS